MRSVLSISLPEQMASELDKFAGTTGRKEAVREKTHLPNPTLATRARIIS